MHGDRQTGFIQIYVFTLCNKCLVIFSDETTWNHLAASDTSCDLSGYHRLLFWYSRIHPGVEAQWYSHIAQSQLMWHKPLLLQRCIGNRNGDCFGNQSAVISSSFSAVLFNSGHCSPREGHQDVPSDSCSAASAQSGHCQSKVLHS